MRLNSTNELWENLLFCKIAWQIQIFLPSAANTFWVATRNIASLPTISLSTIINWATLNWPADVSSLLKEIIEAWWKVFIPMMNSIWGHVETSFDHILKFDNLDSLAIEYVTREPIKHILASTWSESDIKEIHSHPQAIAQCYDKIWWKYKTISTKWTSTFIESWNNINILSEWFDTSNIPSHIWFLLPEEQVSNLWFNNHWVVSPDWNKTTFCCIWKKEDNTEIIEPDWEKPWFYYVDVWWKSWELLAVLFELVSAWVDLDYISSVKLADWKFRIWFASHKYVDISQKSRDTNQISTAISNKMDSLKESLWNCQIFINSPDNSTVNFSIDNKQWSLLVVLLAIYQEKISLDSIHSRVTPNGIVSFEVHSTSQETIDKIWNTIEVWSLIDTLSKDISSTIWNLAYDWILPEINSIAYVKSPFNDLNTALSTLRWPIKDLSHNIIDLFLDNSEKTDFNDEMHNNFINNLKDYLPEWSKISENVISELEKLKTFISSKGINFSSFYSLLDKRFSLTNKVWWTKSHFWENSFYVEDAKNKMIDSAVFYWETKWLEVSDIKELFTIIHDLSYLMQENCYKKAA